jgi:hypothetical protein
VCKDTSRRSWWDDGVRERGWRQYWCSVVRHAFALRHRGTVFTLPKSEEARASASHRRRTASARQSNTVTSLALRRSIHVCICWSLVTPISATASLVLAFDVSKADCVGLSMIITSSHLALNFPFSYQLDPRNQIYAPYASECPSTHTS